MTDSFAAPRTNQEKIADRYILEKIIGQGSYSIVFRGYDTEKHRPVAIKELKSGELGREEADEAQQLFFNEINILKKLRHPRIPRVYDFFIFEGRHYMVMQWIEGKSLLEMVEKGITLSQDEALDYMHRIGEALVYLQKGENWVIYKDLKPSNILVDDKGNLWIIDFGTARFYSPEKKRDTHVLGTPGYAPPEAYSGSQTDFSSDIYSLGATFYHLTTGQEPLQFNFNFPSPDKFKPGLTPEFCKLLLSCLKPKGERISDAKKLLKQMAYFDLFWSGHNQENRRKPKNTSAEAEAEGGPYPSHFIALIIMAIMIMGSLVQEFDFIVFFPFFCGFFILLLPGYFLVTYLFKIKRDSLSWFIYSLIITLIAGLMAYSIFWRQVD